jgi:hypothetical protein
LVSENTEIYAHTCVYIPSIHKATLSDKTKKYFLRIYKIVNNNGLAFRIECILMLN